MSNLTKQFDQVLKSVPSMDYSSGAKPSASFQNAIGALPNRPQSTQSSPWMPPTYAVPPPQMLNNPTMDMNANYGSPTGFQQAMTNSAANVSQFTSANSGAEQAAMNAAVSNVNQGQHNQNAVVPPGAAKDPKEKGKGMMQIGALIGIVIVGVVIFILFSTFKKKFKKDKKKKDDEEEDEEEDNTTRQRGGTSRFDPGRGNGPVAPPIRDPRIVNPQEPYPRYPPNVPNPGMNPNMQQHPIQPPINGRIVPPHQQAQMGYQANPNLNAQKMIQQQQAMQQQAQYNAMHPPQLPPQPPMDPVIASAISNGYTTGVPSMLSNKVPAPQVVAQMQQIRQGVPPNNNPGMPGPVMNPPQPNFPAPNQGIPIGNNLPMAPRPSMIPQTGQNFPPQMPMGYPTPFNPGMPPMNRSQSPMGPNPLPPPPMMRGPSMPPQQMMQPPMQQGPMPPMMPPQSMGPPPMMPPQSMGPPPMMQPQSMGHPPMNSQMYPPMQQHGPLQ